MRYRFLRFPEGKFKAVTLSYDDGVLSDVRFARAIEKYGLKCTFNLNSQSFNGSNPNKLSAERIKAELIDAGHEVAVHGKRHIAPGNASPIMAIKDVLDCRIDMEEEFGTIIRGMAYPDTGIRLMQNGNSYEEIKRYLKDLGIVYARSLGQDNDGFALPDDFYSWIPTAHHKNPNLLVWAKKFADEKEEDRYLTRKVPRLFYLWGHTYEFNNDNNWEIIDEFGEIIGNRDDVWYATNIEIYDYINAYNSLIFSALYNKVYNPTLIDVWMQVDEKVVKIPSGSTINI